MSDCGVCLSYDDGNCDYYIDEWSIITSDEDHKCCECDSVVDAGSPIECATKYRDGDQDADEDEREATEPVWTCVVCAEIADAFYCDGRMFGGSLWDSLYEVHEAMNVACLNKLSTPEAKAELQRRWMQWKGLTA